MNKNNNKEIFKEWVYFIRNTNSNILKESLNIENQIEKAKKKICEVENQKLSIRITKEVNEFVLISEIVDSQNTSFIIDDVAYISFKKFKYSNVIDEESNIRNCYVIDFTEFVKYDLGPLMYDIMIEYVSKDNSVLCPDRFEISNEAKSLWENYFYERNDIKTVQLDIENDSLDNKKFPNLTPQLEDDFYQNVSISHKGTSWYESPFSKGYYKNNAYVIEKLSYDPLFILKGIL
jgi:hypothetical protein